VFVFRGGHLRRGRIGSVLVVGLPVALVVVVVAVAKTTGSVSRGSVSAQPLASSVPARKLITRAQAVAYAKAVNLRASDLPGATSIKGEIFGREAVQYEALKCGLQGRPGIVPAGGGESWLTNRRALADSVVAGVGSLVVVAPSNYYAEAEIAGLQSRAVARASGALSAAPWNSNGIIKVSRRTP